MLPILPATALAQWMDAWHINGSNRLQTEHVENSGNEAASPYRSEGGHTYNDLTLSLNRRVSAYERLSMRFSGVVNDSEYRSDRQGGNLERARVLWEKGDGPVPLRLEGGDIYAFQSTRTVQTSLKGAQIEFQPGSGSLRQSVQLFAGQQAATYRDFDGDQPTYTGASWLMEQDSFGALSLNASRGRQEVSTGGNGDRQQQVYSVAHAVPFDALAQSFTLESEVAYLTGDEASGTGDSESDTGLYVQLDGHAQNLPLSYRSAYSEYGQNYQPFAAGVASDQRSLENYAAWRFAGGRFLRGRYLTYRDGLESDNPIDTQTGGLTLGGPFLELGVYQMFGSIDAFVSEREDEDNTLETRVSTLNASFSTPVTPQLNTRVSFLGQKREDQLAPVSSEYLRQGNVAVDYRFQIASLSASLSPGVMYREIDGTNRDSHDLNPTLSGSLRGAGHALRFSYNSLRQKTREPTHFDVLTQRASLQYDYTHEQHRVGLETVYYDRQPETQNDTFASRVMLFWEYRFSKAPEFGRTARAPGPRSEAGVSITRFGPGEPVASVVEALDAEGLGQPQTQGDLLIYDAPVLESVQRRQRLVYETAGGRILSSNLIIDFDAIGDGRSEERIFNDLLGDLILRYGAPDIQIEEGEFGPDLPTRLATDQFVRVYEWNVDGRSLRFGIPSRNDGLVRMELRYARSLPPAAQNEWSLNELR